MLTLRSILHQRQVAVDVQYKDHVIQGQRLDLLVQNQVVVEIKALRMVPEVATAQVLSYLKATGLKTALLINFGVRTLADGIKRFSL